MSQIVENNWESIHWESPIYLIKLRYNSYTIGSMYQYFPGKHKSPTIVDGSLQANQLMLKRIWHSTINNINENCSLLRLNITIPKLTGRESISALLKHDISDHLGLALPSINTMLPNTTLAYSRGYFCSLNLVTVYSYHQAKPSASDREESRLHTIVHKTLVHGWRSYHGSVALQCLICSQILLSFPIWFA